ncbi:DUF6174 domain-containing protein [Streptomyces sp. NPDC048751]|uniref:DUF6174 domain-containing protein n=1 Tax=Streptomyces sp. NPDC048751 TaxID=3365591 RepID=UPI00371E0E88
MTAVRSTARALLPCALLTACGTTATPAAEPSRPVWTAPPAYTYTLTSSEGERTLIGTFRVTVRDGEVVHATGLDEGSRRVVRQSPDAIPTLTDLLAELDQARDDHADVTEARYAKDGHPLRIELDWDEGATDDEARYVISAYEAQG